MNKSKNISYDSSKIQRNQFLDDSSIESALMMPSIKSCCLCKQTPLESRLCSSSVSRLSSLPPTDTYLTTMATAHVVSDSSSVPLRAYHRSPHSAVARRGVIIDRPSPILASSPSTAVCGRSGSASGCVQRQL